MLATKNILSAMRKMKLINLQIVEAGQKRRNGLACRTEQTQHKMQGRPNILNMKAIFCAGATLCLFAGLVVADKFGDVKFIGASQAVAATPKAALLSHANKPKRLNIADRASWTNRVKPRTRILLAQNTANKKGTQLKVGKDIVAQPGQTVAVPVQTQSNTPIASTSHIIIDGAPSWLKLTKGEAVGDGVWLLRASELTDLKMKLPASAKGSHEMNVLLVDKDGKIVSEAQMALTVQASGGGGGGGSKTWQSLLQGGGGAPPGAVPTPKKVVKKFKPAVRKSSTGVKKKMNPKQERDYAKYLVRECTTCHSLFGDDSGIPVMVGIKVDRFMDTMQLYRDGKRDNLAMINVARSLDDQQLQALANYLGGVRPAAKVAKARAAAPNGGSILGSGGAATITASAPTTRTSRPVASSATGRISQPVLALAKRKITPVKLKRADRWVAKGSALLKAGRVAQARLWFKRAAEYGVAKAAMLLGSSFDPNYLIARSGGGLLPNPGKAKDWYLYARQLGSQVAAQRLANLPAG